MSCKNEDCKNKPIPRGKYCEIHRIGKICKENDCNSCAQGKTNYCKKHGGGIRCKESSCKKSVQSKTEYCITHGGGKRCKEPECKSSSIGKTDYCVAHGGGKRCKEIDCKSGASGKTEYCKSHGGGKRCKEPECKSGARSNSDYCVVHGGGKRCKGVDCKSGAAGKTDYCLAHGGGKRCKELDCKISARGKTDYCISHGGGKRCPNCIDWIDSRSGNIKYDGYCATCFKRIFPDDIRSKIIYEHSKEIQVRNSINEKSETNKSFTGFIHDKPLYTGQCDCTHRRRIDHRKLIGNTILAVETDEFAHRRGYDEKDEEIRYDDLYMIHSGKWIYIRFNPDVTQKDKTDIEDRIDILLKVIEEQIERIKKEENKDLVEIIKLFY